jgi:hypothetical protein
MGYSGVVGEVVLFGAIRSLPLRLLPGEGWQAAFVAIETLLDVHSEFIVAREFGK